MIRFCSACFVVTIGAVLMVSAPVTMALADDDSRFVRLDALLSGPTDWLSVDGDRVAFGSGRRVAIASVGTPPQLQWDVERSAPISSGVLVENGIYVTRGGSLRHVELHASPPRTTEIALSPAPRGELSMTRMPDHLIVAENGAGLRILALPPPQGMLHTAHAHAHLDIAAQVGFLPLEATFTALTTSGTSVYAAVEGEGIVVIEAGDVAHPRILRHLPAPGDVIALSANGPTLYVLGSSGLSILDSSEGSVTGTFPDVRGNALQLTGRTLVVGVDSGLSKYRDLTPAAATVFVTIGNFFFAPQTVNVAVGDTVQWDYAGGAAMHNVEACDPTPPPGASTYCNANGAAAEGFFTSGPPTASAFTFQQMFTVPGANPYYCVVHVAGGMVGTVNVAAAPPGVPDGAGGSPLLVGKLPLIANGSRLALSWDTSTCSPIDDHQIVYGFGSGLPTSLGGSYTVSGSRCDVGGSPLQPFTWSPVPDPALQDPSTNLLWFLMLTNDNGSTEGSWGLDAAGNERNGTTASGECGVIAKSLSNICGQ